MTTPPDELAFLEQALRHLEGTLGAEETRQLERALAEDPARARRFAALAMQRVQLHEMGRARHALPRAGAPARRWWRRPWPWPRPLR